MIKVSSDADKVLVAKFHEAVQDQVFACWENLTAAEQEALLAQLRAMDLGLVRKLIARYLQGSQEVLESRVLSPAPLLPAGGQGGPGDAEAREAGEEAIHKGTVGILTASGEMGNRLEFDRPKGTYPIGPVSGKTLFRLHAEKIRAISRRYRSAIPWIVATSPSNHDATVAHFRAEDWFGLNRADVSFITQEELPVVNRRGKILLASPSRVAMAPNGHGGVLQRLLTDECFEAVEVRSLEHIFYFQVDNPLVRIADPVFIGHHILRACEVSSKAVRKDDPDERVGIFCRFNGSLGIVEHRELSEADRLRRTAEGSLEFSAGNIGIHVFSTAFLRRLREDGLALEYHFAEKKTPYVERRGSFVVPRQPNSIQFECFIFDALPLARSTLVLEACREDEFSPVKCLNGRDSLTTAKRDLSRLYARWLRESGATIHPGNGEELEPIEISPLFALDQEELKSKLEAPIRVAPNFYLE